MLRTRPNPTRPPVRPTPPCPLPEDWLILTEADRAVAGLGAALARTSRWQGNAG